MTGDDPAFATDATVAIDGVSMWFGQKVALSELSCSFGPGLTGLLGPNGAGKTTLMRAVVGLLPPNAGRVRVLGEDPRASRGVHARLSLVPEDDAVPLHLTCRGLVTYRAALCGVTDPALIEHAIATVALAADADRPVRTFSKGMRQRAKVAAALVHDPEILVLDEPLNGADPVQRQALIALFHQLAAEGRTVVVSSHVLSEVERMANRVIVLVGGRLAAAGDRRAIRDAMADLPRQVAVVSAEPRRLAARLVDLEVVTSVTLEAGRTVVSTRSAADLAVALSPLAADAALGVREVIPLDDSLDAMFRDVVAAPTTGQPR